MEFQEMLTKVFVITVYALDSTTPPRCQLKIFITAVHGGQLEIIRSGHLMEDLSQQSSEYFEGVCLPFTSVVYALGKRLSQ